MTFLQKRTTFRRWKEKTELETMKMLGALLITPVQRIPRYRLLLQDVLKQTEVRNHR